MGDYLKLLDKAAGVVGLGDDLKLIEKLIEMVENWVKLSQHISSVDTAEAFLGKFLSDLDDSDVKKAFNDAGLTSLYTDLLGLLKKVKDTADKVPDEIKKLIRPISSFSAADAADDAGVIGWTPIDKDESFGAGGEFSFSFGGSAVLSLQAGDKVKIGDGPERRLLKIGADLGVHAKAGVKLPFPQGTGAVGAEASAGAKLFYYFDTGASNSLYGFEVAKRLAKLPNPFDFDAVWQAFASADLELAMVSYEFDGAAKANVELSLANSASFGADLVAEIALSLAADFSLSNTYSLTLAAGRPLTDAGGNQTGEREIDVSLTRKKTTDEGIALGLQLHLDLLKATARIRADIAKAVDQWDSELKEIKPFLSPGTYLQTKVSDFLGDQAKTLIQDAGLRAAVLRDLRGTIGIDTSNDPAVLSWLEGEISGAIDSGRGILTGKADDAVDSVLAILGNRLPAFAQADIVAKVKPAIAALIGKVDDALKARVGELFNTAKGPLGKALKAVGAQASEAVADADQALASVRKVIGQFDTFIHDTVAKLSDANTMQISAGLQAEERRADETVSDVAGTLEADNPVAAAAFHALTRGDLSGIKKLFDGSPPLAGFHLDPDPKKSKLQHYSKRTSSMGYQVTILGFAASGHIIASGDARVTVDASGTVQVAGSATVENQFNGPRESRTVSFVQGFSLLRARIAGTAAPADRSLDVTVGITHHDQSLKRDEMMGFLTSLSHNGLLPDAVLQRAGDHFTAWTGTSAGNARLAADIATKLWLSPGELETLMMLDAREPYGRLKREAAIRIVDVALTAALTTGALVKIKGDRLNDALSFIRSRYRDNYPSLKPAEIVYDMVVPGEDPDARGRGELPASWTMQLPSDGDGIHLRGDVEQFLQTTRLQFQHLVALIQTMGEIYLAQPQQVGQPSPLGWDQPQYAAKEQQLAFDAAGWLKTGGHLLFWIDAAVQPWTIALLWTLATLARGNRANALSLTLTRPAHDSVAAETFDLTVQ